MLQSVRFITRVGLRLPVLDCNAYLEQYRSVLTNRERNCAFFMSDASGKLSLALGPKADDQSYILSKQAGARMGRDGDGSGDGGMGGRRSDQRQRGCTPHQKPLLI